MNKADVFQNNECGMQELNAEEIECISGGGGVLGKAAIGAAGAIGAATFGSSWGAVAVGVAFGAAPLAVVAMTALTMYGVYSIMRD